MAEVGADVLGELYWTTMHADPRDAAMATTSIPTTPIPPSLETSAPALDASAPESGTHEWRDLLAEILPVQGRWSVEQYLVLTDHRSRLIEFSDGFLEVLPMPTDQHRNIVEFLYRAVFQFIKPRGGKVHFAPVRLLIRPGKFREPDLMLLRLATDPRRENRFWRGADLALEVVSEDKPERDLVDKRGDYAEAGVPEYWIVNPRTQSITVLRLHAGKYEEAGVFHRGQSAASVLLPEFSVVVDEVFDAD